MPQQLHDERAENLQLELVIEHKLSSVETWRAAAELNAMEPSAVPDNDHQHQLSLADVHSMSAIHYPHLDFSESSLSTKEMEMVTQAIQSQAITPAEQAIGLFTGRKLCSLSTWEQWCTGEHKQLDHFHDLKMHGEPVRKHLVLFFCAHIGSVPLSEMAHDAPATAVMAHPDPHHCCTALLQPILPVLNNPHNDFSLPLLHEKTVESMEAMLKMLVHTLRHPRLPLSHCVD